MNGNLINQEYLSELIHVAEDQEANDLVPQMFERLTQSRSAFLASSDQMLKDESKLSFELHKLKNQFANLGCEAVAQLLEKMYQLAKQHDIQEVERLMPDFNQLSDTTLKELGVQLRH